MNDGATYHAALMEQRHAVHRAREQVKHWKLKKYAAERVDERVAASARLNLWQSDLNGQLVKLTALERKGAA